MLVGSFILAGGRSRRMGQPKESLPFAGNSLLGRTVETLLECTWPVVVIGRGGDQQLPPFPLEATTIADDDPGHGPLAAIATGLRAVLKRKELGEQDAVFVTGCDAPFLGTTTIGWLAGQLGDSLAVMPKAGGLLQPLCAIYRVSCLPTIEQMLRDQIVTPRTLAEKVATRVLEEPELRRFDPELKFLRNINTPEEYEQARRLAGG